MAASFAERVRARDGKCRICQSTENLQAHHLFSANVYIELKGKINNGLALCADHHQEFHDMYGGNCSGMDFLDWLYQRFHKKKSVSSFALLLNLIQPIAALQRMVDESYRNKMLSRQTEEETQAFLEQIKEEQADFIQLKIPLDASEINYFEKYCEEKGFTFEQAVAWLIQKEVSELKRMGFGKGKRRRRRKKQTEEGE